MKPMWYLACVGIALTCLASPGCDQKAPEVQLDAGYFRGSQYRNDYLGMSLTLPETWVIQDEEARRQLKRSGQDLVAGDNKNLQAAFEESQSRSHSLFMVFQYPLGSPVLCNASIVSGAEDVTQSPGIRNGADFLFHMRRYIESSQMQFTFGDEVRRETLDGVEFHVQTMELVLPDITVQQEVYATVRRGYAVTLVLSFGDEEQKDALHGILQTLSFSPSSEQ